MPDIINYFFPSPFLFSRTLSVLTLKTRKTYLDYMSVDMKNHSLILWFSRKLKSIDIYLQMH